MHNVLREISGVHTELPIKLPIDFNLKPLAKRNVTLCSDQEGSGQQMP